MSECSSGPNLVPFLSIPEKNKLDELNKRFHVKGTEGKSLVPQLMKADFIFFCKLLCIINTRANPGEVWLMCSKLSFRVTVKVAHRHTR